PLKEIAGNGVLAAGETIQRTETVLLNAKQWSQRAATSLGPTVHVGNGFIHGSGLLRTKTCMRRSESAPGQPGLSRGGSDQGRLALGRFLQDCGGLGGRLSDQLSHCGLRFAGDSRQFLAAYTQLLAQRRGEFSLLGKKFRRARDSDGGLRLD